MKDQNTSKQNRKIESQLAVQSTLLAESILDALVSTLLGPYLHYKASKLRNTKEWKAVQKRIKDLDAEYEALEKAADKLSDKADESEKRGKQSFSDYTEKQLEKAFGKRNIKPAKSTKRL